MEHDYFKYKFDSFKNKGSCREVDEMIATTIMSVWYV